MDILLMKITIRNSWVGSLKEKRMIVRSVTQRLKNKFNISVGEVDRQDEHKFMVIGIAAVCGNVKIAHSTKEKILDFLEENIEGKIIDIEEETEIF
ncbi:DUF503 domain-containing protein [Clostridium sardiniense]|uniref:DUF503 domain-containing protein n=1 Tax=Clostridium sardiniense TaxID=29369 RepID=A0ABS7KWU9_CLOSR|nr:DUF503 domain-containing protein [Clostridium sardiniense]MBY0755294.1 DUF503 domain-containing protein [Clostridium sardiniense]MDQ0459738.1 uncharacterized protein YlxP (DUF503 family) [Clostridium sardiniense]